MRPTVHDIAERAGVSLATVDRVLNRRPGVRGVTRARVEAAIAELGYIRDVAAANLAKNRLYPLVFILPEGDNPFMRRLEEEALRAGASSPVDRIQLTVVTVPAFDGPALAREIDEAIARSVAGIAAVAVDAPEVLAAIGRARDAGVPFVTLVSDLANSDRDHFVGVDNIAAGRTAGSLMGRFLGERPGPVAVLAGSMRVRDHGERLEGFLGAMANMPFSRAVLPVLEGQDDPDLSFHLIADCVASVPGLAGIYSLGAGNRGLLKALSVGHAQSICVIAHELTAETRKGLEDGLVDAVLNQDAGHEVRSAIRVLRAKADGLPVIAGQERIRLEIFIKDNLPAEPDAGALAPVGN